MDTGIYMTKSLCCEPETITTLLTGCTPILKKSLKENSGQTLDSVYRKKLPCHNWKVK